MKPRQRTALFSVVAAGVLVVLKMTVGLISGSLGLVADAVHSGTDLVAAILTLLAVRVAVRPPDRGHPFGHGKAEHLAALAEGAILLVASGIITAESVSRLASHSSATAAATWYAFATIGVVMLVDLSRAAVSWRAGNAYNSPALKSNALHFASDFASSLTVGIGLVLVRAGYKQADSIAALCVAALVVVAAARLMRENIQVLMDRVPREAEQKARSAIEELSPRVQLRRLRLREAAGRYFADAVIGVRQDAGVGQAHATADEVERAVQDALPGTDVVVHVEPRDAPASLREQVSAAAMGVRGVREVHNVSLLEVDGTTELSLHLKLPSGMSLRDAHEVATRVEAEIAKGVSDVSKVRTHIEPLSEPEEGSQPAARQIATEREGVKRLVRELTGAEPVELEFRETGDGLVVFLTLGMEATSRLAAAHSTASELEERLRAAYPQIADVLIHTQPAA